MASTTRFSLSAEQEADAQALAQRIRELTEEEVVQMARLLVSKRIVRSSAIPNSNSATSFSR